MKTILVLFFLCIGLISSEVSLDTVAQIIRNNNVVELEKLLKNGFDKNKQYDYPIGCNRYNGGYYNGGNYYNNGYYGNGRYDKKVDGIDKIQWTILQYATALNQIDIVEFLIKQNVDISIKDELKRNAQEIANHLDIKINIQDIKSKIEKEREIENERMKKELNLFKIKEKERIEKEKELKLKLQKEEKEREENAFPSFMSDSNKFMKTIQGEFNNNKKIYSIIVGKYDSFKKGKLECEQCDKVIMENLSKSSHHDIKVKLANPSFIRHIYSKTEVLSNLKNNLENGKLSQSMEIFIIKEKHALKSNSTKSIPQIYHDIYNHLYENWKNETTPFMDELDTHLGFQEKVQQAQKVEILKMIKNGSIKDFDYAEIFPDVEKNLKLLKAYFDFFSGEETDTFKIFQENLELKKSIETMNARINKISETYLNKIQECQKKK